MWPHPPSYGEYTHTHAHAHAHAHTHTHTHTCTRTHTHTHARTHTHTRTCTHTHTHTHTHTCMHTHTHTHTHTTGQDWTLTLVCLEVGKVPDHLPHKERVSELVKHWPRVQQNIYLLFHQNTHSHQHKSNTALTISYK